ncbi:hypothetical protein ABG067_002281 [Albugo candida]|uniref:Calcyclin-binding protein n=1 Tax=Albugo candida TaxID=65357 RepID=A0A024FZA9_9STRA|nr:unnamed protein product [Albugo candida]|eukprot:CCI39899.1 unnamed protein product [Albugo candida]
MIGNTNTEMTAEIQELKEIISQHVRTEGNKRDLQTLLATKQQHAALAEDGKRNTSSVHLAPEPVKLSSTAPTKTSSGSDLTEFSSISRFGWEDEGFGKDKVMIYITTGVDGVGELPSDNIQCNFTKTSLDLKILDLHDANYRLVVSNLDKPIVPSECKYRIKKNRITIILKKEDKNTSWTSLTSKNPSSSNKPTSSDPAAGIMDLMKNMYEEGDDEMKKTIAKAWTESRAKSGAAF